MIQFLVLLVLATSPGNGQSDFGDQEFQPRFFSVDGNQQQGGQVFAIRTQQQNPQPQQIFLIRQQAPVAPQPVAIRTIAVATPQPIAVAVTPQPIIEARSNEDTSDRSGPAEPYSFGYNTHDEHGATLTRQEESDGHGVVKGSYGYTSPDGLYRTVEYIADENGYRATIKTNEPGMANQDPADVKIVAEPPPANLIQHVPVPVQAPPPPPQPVRVVLQAQPQPRPIQIVAAPQPQIRFVTAAAPQPQIRFVTASPQPQISFVTAAPPQQTLRFVTAAPQQQQGFRIIPLPLANQQFAAPPQFRNFESRRRA